MQIKGFRDFSDPAILRRVACTAFLLLWVVLSGCQRAKDRPKAEAEPQGAAQVAAGASHPLSRTELEAIEPQVVGFCGNCHASPNPEYFIAEDWPREVQRGFDFYYASGRSDLRVPKRNDVSAYYQTLAPRLAPLAQPALLDVPARERFEWLTFRSMPGEQLPFAGAGLSVANFKNLGGRGLVVSDMRGGRLLWLPFDALRPAGSQPGALLEIANLRNPSRSLVGDFDADGAADLFVADLGSFLPADHKRGRVLWLRPKPQGQLDLEVTEIFAGSGRVADVQAGDFDGDSDLDLVVADFGWHETGRVLWLERVAPEMLPTSFKVHEVDSRPGAMQVPVIDIDGDGDLDFLALIAQEFEVVVAYINNGQGEFTAKTLFDMGDPASGSSGMDLVDIDGDGDLDIVHTNGDSFDSFHVKTYHGVRWLENQGQLNFAAHPIASMPGVHRAMPTDLDCDGDIDLVAVAFLPAEVTAELENKAPEAIVWFENDGAQNFERRPLKVGQAIHPVVLIDDFDGDGRPDIATLGFCDTAANCSVELEIAIAR